MNNRIGFFNNKIILKEANSVIPDLDFKSSAPDHPYGLSLEHDAANYSRDPTLDKSHQIRVNWDEDPIYRGTPAWNKYNAQIKKFFDNKADLQDLASAYHIPGMQAQRLRLRLKPDINILQAHYMGQHPDSSMFKYDLAHNNNDERNVEWEYVNNSNKNNKNLLYFLKRSIPFYQKIGNKYIKLYAVSSNQSDNIDEMGKHREDMNGVWTWPKLGFNFSRYDKSNIHNNASNMIKELESQIGFQPNLHRKLETATHSFEFQNIAKQIALLEHQHQLQTRSNARHKWNKMVSPEGRGLNADMGLSLNMDPNDKGFKRLMYLLKSNHE